MNHFYPCDIDYNCVRLRDQIRQESSFFISKLYDLDELPRCKVQTIVEDCSSLIKNNMRSIYPELLDRLGTLGETPGNIDRFTNAFDAMSAPFASLETEWQRFTYLEERGTYIPPQAIPIGEREDYKSKDIDQQSVTVPVSIEFIPLTVVLKKFLELPDMMYHVINYLEKLDKDPDLIQNLTEGKRWKNKMNLFPDKLVLPLILYYDGFEPNNPLGTHASVSNVGGIYVNIPCLPPSIVSKIENILIFILFHTLDKSYLSFEKILTKAIDELVLLETEGIEISYAGTTTRVYFSLATVIGDNLAVHEIAGFMENFDSNYCCRFCLTHRGDFSSIFDEDSCTLRNIENYNEHLSQREPANTGIKNPCIFNRLQSFHNIEDSAADPVHDIFEGTLRYDLGQLLWHFIKVKRYFTLDKLNDRIKGCHYGINEKQNTPRAITPTQLKNKYIIMSAAEMLSFIRNIHVLIGDLIPVDDEHWELLIKIKGICDIITAKVVHKDICC